MKFCPVCQTRYDEQIIKFCTRDGTPLVDDNPTFTAMPSQTSIGDDEGETVIRRNRPNGDESFGESSARNTERVVIPMRFEEKHQTARPLENPPPAAAPLSPAPAPARGSNVGLIVAVTILGTLAALAGAGGVWWLLRGGGEADRTANINANANANVAADNSNLDNNNGSLANLNANTNSNANTNANANINTNTNTNANSGTPTPTRTPTPAPTPDADSNANANANANANPPRLNLNTNVNRPATPAPSAAPRISPSPANQNVNVGIINSRAINLTKPTYPATARAMGVSGQVSVNVVVDESGNVLAARAIAGHPLLRPACEAAARQSRFNPVKINNQTVRATGTIVYSFINN